MFVIDISHHQSISNYFNRNIWKCYDSDRFMIENVKRIIIRTHYGVIRDRLFEQHIENARQRGIEVETYIWIRPNLPNQHIDFIDVNTKYNIKRAWIDIEENGLTDDFCYPTIEKVKNNGFCVGIYSRDNIINKMPKSMSISDAYWIASYTYNKSKNRALCFEQNKTVRNGSFLNIFRKPISKNKYIGWQFTSAFKIDNYAGDIDMNYFSE